MDSKKAAYGGSDEIGHAIYCIEGLPIISYFTMIRQEPAG